MTPRRIALSLTCRGIVALWIGAYLAWSTLDPSAEVEAAANAARVQPRALAVAAAAPPAEPIAIGAADLKTGNALLDGAGTFPALHCSYDRFPSFLAYARAMERLGARFVVVRSRRIVGAWDLATNQLRETPIDARFSPRARDYTEEPALRAVVRAAGQRFGEGAEVMMVVPRALDAGLFGGIARAMERAGETHEAFRELHGHYRPAAAGGVQIEVVSGRRADGDEVNLELLFDLGDIAGASS